MDFGKELTKATRTRGMSIEIAQKMIPELEKSIEAREQRGECECGETPCRNSSHEAIDRMILCQLRIVVSNAGGS